jgi:hypothetical protein
MLNSVACFHVTNLLTRSSSVVALLSLPTWLRKRLRMILFATRPLDWLLGACLCPAADVAAAMLVVLRRDDRRNQFLHEL